MGTEIDVKEGRTKLKYKERPKKEEEEEKNPDDINKKEEVKSDKSGESENHKNKSKNKKSNKDKLEKEKDNEEINNNKSEKAKEEIKIDNPEDLKDEVIIPKEIEVKIKLDDGYWERKYDKETPLNKIRADFQQANNLEDIKKNHYIEFIYNNSPLQMDSRPLESILEEGKSEIFIYQEIKQIPGIIKQEIIEPVDYIGKPLANPFEVYIFEIRKKIISKIKYSKEKERNYGLNKYGINSAYCNGFNQLFISGGVDPYSNEILNDFLIIDLMNKTFKRKLNMPKPKKNHSMIYSQNKVYIIGGNDESTMYYDINHNEMIEWSTLKIKKFEPSLIRYNNYLFCIDSSNKYSNEYNFEKINLLSEDNPEWELVKPQISPDILNLDFTQKFFGLLEDKNENIIFIGGIYDNNIEDNIGFNNYFNLQYNVEDNSIERKDMNLKINDYKEITLKEKSFLSMDENTYIIFPDFKRRAPKVLYFYKDRNALEINSYHSNPRLTKIANQNRKTFLGEYLKELNFNMPPLKRKNIYINENFKSEFGGFNEEKNGISSVYNKYFKKRSSNDNNITNDKYNFEKNKIIEIPPIRKNNYQIQTQKEISFLIKSMKVNNNININPEIIPKIKENSINVDYKNYFMKKGKEENTIIKTPKKVINPEIIKAEVKEPTNEIHEKPVDDSKDKVNIEPSENRYEINKKTDDIKESKNKSIEESKKEEEKEEKEKTEEKVENKEEDREEKKEEKEETIEGSKKGSDKLSMNKNINKNGNNINNSNITKTSKSKDKSMTNIEIFDHDKAYSLVTFHSSVNDAKANNFAKLENNRAVKKGIVMKYLVQPKEVNVKSLKKSRRKFNNFDYNGLDDDNNY